MAPQIQFVLGGARSGKSAHAEMLTQQSAGRPADSDRLVYIATAEIFDDEMAARVDLHRQRRGPEWALVEAPVNLSQAISENDSETTAILVDCLSVWTTNLLIHEHDMDKTRQELVDTIRTCRGRLVLVASETGLGIVPDNALSRRFRDANGLLNQAIAAAADEVFFMMAGIALRIKPQQ
ncbi:bifunctional adenosylcobinamide kinase/adenosylcobinamide-phosphate guanylyltransferase [Alphaproteobacteria bacterium LSUCC0719]